MFEAELVLVALIIILETHDDDVAYNDEHDGVVEVAAVGDEAVG